MRGKLNAAAIQIRAFFVPVSLCVLVSLWLIWLENCRNPNSRVVFIGISNTKTQSHKGDPRIMRGKLNAAAIQIRAFFVPVSLCVLVSLWLV